MSDAQHHREEGFLIKMFAFRTPLPNVIALFREEYGHNPTEEQIAVTNIGAFLKDKHAVFKTNDRVKEFKRWRSLYEENIDAIDIKSPRFRMEKLDHIYKQLEPVAMESGNWGRCLDVLKQAAMESAGGFGQKKEITIDNRTINMNLSNDELNRKLRDFEEALGFKLGDHLGDLPLVEHGATVIEGEVE